MSWIELVAQRRPPTAPPGMQPPENAADWYRIENNATDPDATDVYVYDSIGGWFGVYADEFIQDLKGISSSNINLRINSPGGSVFDGVAIANAIRSHPANVTVYVDGLAASIASVIALAGNKLVMMPQTSFMIHDASGGCYGNAAEMEYMRNLLDKQSDNIAAAYAAAAGGTTEEWRARMKDETWYTAQECVDAGLADEVMAIPKKGEDAEDPAAQAPTPVYARMQAAWDLAAYKYAGRENAPAPVVPAPFAAGSVITASTVAALKPGEIIVKLGMENPGATLLDMIRDTVRQAIHSDDERSAAEAHLDADGGEEEAPVHEDVSGSAESDKSPDSTDEEQQVIPEGPTAVEVQETVKEEIPLGDNAVESVETYDEWSQLAAHLIESPSPSADDVFNAFKEAL